MSRVRTLGGPVLGRWWMGGGYFDGLSLVRNRCELTPVVPEKVWQAVLGRWTDGGYFDGLSLVLKPMRAGFVACRN